MMLDKRIEYDRNVPVRAYVSHIYEQPVHTHKDDLEIFVVLKGTIRAVVGYSNLLLKEGEVMIFNDKEVHGVYETEGENLVLTVHINIKYFKKYNEAGYDSFFLMAATYLNGLRYDKPVAELREHLFDIAKAQMMYTSSDEKLEMLGKELLNRLLADFQYFYYSSSGGRHFLNRYEGKNHQAQAVRMRMLMYYLWENYNQKITLQEYADATHINMYYLSHIIKESTGLNFQELLNYTRVEASEFLLLETDKKISEIAFDCGFSATRYYVKHFEKWFQVSPEEYREKHLKRLTMMYREDILTGDDAIEIINEFSGQKRYLTTGKSYFYTDILEIDTGKKCKAKRKKYNQVIMWNSNINLQSESEVQYGRFVAGEVIKNIKESFKLCIPIISENDFNSRVLSFLKERNTHSLFVSYEVSHYNKENLDSLIIAFKEFCQKSEMQTINIIVEYKGRMKAKEGMCEKLITAGQQSGCNVLIKGIPYFSERTSKNYFKDSIYAVPWIIRSSLKNGYDQKFINSIFDEDESTGHLITGGNGIITSSGIKKPSYYAYMCLSMLGNDIVENSESYIVTKKGEDIQILLYDYDDGVFEDIDDYTDWEQLKSLRFVTEKNKEYKLELSSLSGKYTATQISLGREICLFNKFVDMGAPDVISLEQERTIQEFTKPMLDFLAIDGSNGEASLDVKVPRYGASLLLLNKDLGF